MVDEAATTVAAKGFSNVTGKPCDVQELPFEGAAFDNDLIVDGKLRIRTRTGTFSCREPR